MGKRKQNDDDDDIEVKKFKQKENRLVYHSVATLKNLAAARIARALWYHQNIRNVRPSLGFDWQSPVPEDEMLEGILDVIEEQDVTTACFFAAPMIREIRGSFEMLCLFKEIKEVVSNYLDLIKEQLESWKKYQFRRIFFDHDEKEVYKYLDEIEWNSEGLVDYRATARNMLSSPKITQMEKFRIACTYCIKEEIDKASPVLFGNKYREPVLFESHPLICYWNCYVTKEWHKISFENYQSVECRMMDEVDNECALEYFFGKFSEQDKLTKARSLIHRYGVEYQIFALSQLNDTQQRQVFEQMAPQIITNFATPPSWSAHALETWLHVKDFVTENQFIEIIGNLLNLWIEEDKRGFFHLPALIAKVWRTASDDFKRCGVNHIENEQIIAQILEKPFPHLINISNLLLTLLPDLSDDTKKNVIRSDGCFFMFDRIIDLGWEVDLIVEFIKICLHDENEALEFKKRVTQMRVSKNRFLHLTSLGHEDEADKFIAKFLPHSNALDDYKEELLMSHFGFSHFAKMLGRSDYSFFRSVIEETLTRNGKAVEFVKEFMTSDIVIERLHDCLLENELNAVKACLDEFCRDEVVIEAVKTNLFRPYRGRNIIKLFSQLDRERSKEFLLWCLNGEQNVARMKRKLPFDCIFQKTLKKSVFIHYDRKVVENCVVNKYFDFSLLDDFLKWFFDDDEAVKRFKIDRINDFHQIEILNTHRWEFWFDKKILVKTIFRWFFEGDQHAIEKFKASNKFCQLNIHDL